MANSLQMTFWNIFSWMKIALFRLIPISVKFVPVCPNENEPALIWGIAWGRTGPWFDIKMFSYQYNKSHCGDNTVIKSSYLHNGISYIWVRWHHIVSPPGDKPFPLNDDDLLHWLIHEPAGLKELKEWPFPQQSRPCGKDTLSVIDWPQAKLNGFWLQGQRHSYQEDKELLL